MGVLYDYFIAPDDQAAVTAIDRSGGPGHPGDRPEEPAFPTVDDTGLDPVVQGGTLEEILTGRPYEQVATDPRWGAPLAVRDEGERLILTLTDGLVDALAGSDRDRLAAAAVPWSQTDEFWGAADPDDLTEALMPLAALAHEARARGWGMYCWVCV